MHALNLGHSWVILNMILSNTYLSVYKSVWYDIEASDLFVRFVELDVYL